MTKDFGEVFAVAVEFRDQCPIIMETEGPATSHEAAVERMRGYLARPDCLRACVVRIEYGDFGNALLIHDLKRMQK